MVQGHPNSRRFVPALALALALVASATLAGIGAAVAGAAGPALKPFSDCDPLRDYLRDHRRQVRIADRYAPGVALEDSAGAPGASAPQASAPAAPPSQSGTNVQEQGVDEPDLVKTDGETIFAIAGDELHAVDASSGTPAEIGSLKLPERAEEGAFPEEFELLLAGDRALVLATSYAAEPRTLLAEIDVSDPTSMRTLNTMSVEGNYVSARLSGATARVVVSATPELPVAERGHGRAWLPSATVRDRVAGERSRSRLFGCQQVSRAKRFSGVGMLSVLTLDLNRGLPEVDADVVMSSGEIVYGSPESLYVATSRWVSPEASAERLSSVDTEIHKFDVADPAATEYVASGRVEGYMLSQWSMSEHEGVLRVASTTEPPWVEDAPRGKSESFVTSLVSDAGRLVEVGRLGGLGEDERIYAVRFIGELGYVVTFREVDPLYVVDLADPTAPALLGELKVPGYSAYLHPVGEGLLLGVGQAANESTGATTGVQVSLFDVSDPANPVRRDVESLGPDSYSEIEYDHHAFFHAPERQLAVVPFESYAADGYAPSAAGLRVDLAAADPIARIADASHGTAYRAQIRRTIAVGDRVFTLSEKGVAVHDPASFTRLGFAAF
jgi:uncharacterized secreted protein with C-terminal beta-propeller domain